MICSLAMAEKKINRRTIVQGKITRKVISKAPIIKEPEEAPKTEEVQKYTKSKKTCLFCQSKTNPSYTDIAVLRRFITDRIKIVAKDKSNVCSKHQRAVARHIKYARHLALLPFVPKV